ncbi:hypothetical protein BHE74_00030670 [Ensete ventricosum]|nr:hypothetical protein BHE74_00030670 [Ensete ventricosum]
MKVRHDRSPTYRYTRPSQGQLWRRLFPRFNSKKRKRLQRPKKGASDYTLGYNANLAIGGISPGTHHPGEGLSLQEQIHKIGRKICIKAITQAEHPRAPSPDSTSRWAPLALAAKLIALGGLPAPGRDNAVTKRAATSDPAYRRPTSIPSRV